MAHPAVRWRTGGSQAAERPRTADRGPETYVKYDNLGSGATSLSMTTARYAEQFLLCLLEASEGSLAEFLDPETIMQSTRLDMPERNAILSTLIEQGYVTSGGETRDRPVYALKFTSAGVEHAQHLRRISRSKAERDVYLHNCLVRWGYDNTPAGKSASLQDVAGGG